MRTHSSLSVVVRGPVQAAAAAAEALSALSGAKSEDESADTASATAADSSTQPPASSDLKHAPSIAVSSGPDAAKAQAAAAAAAAAAKFQQAQMVNGVSKEQMDDMISDLRGLHCCLRVLFVSSSCHLLPLTEKVKGQNLATYLDKHAHMYVMSQTQSDSSTPNSSLHTRRFRR